MTDLDRIASQLERLNDNIEKLVGIPDRMLWDHKPCRVQYRESDWGHLVSPAANGTDDPGPSC